VTSQPAGGPAPHGAGPRLLSEADATARMAAHAAKIADDLSAMLPGGYSFGYDTSLIIRDEVTLTEAQWTEVMNRWGNVVRGQVAHAWPLLPWRTRLRLAIHRRITAIGCWLGDHVSWAAAEWLWRATGLLGRGRR
jgi:flavin-binding protein dodecin